MGLIIGGEGDDVTNHGRLWLARDECCLAIYTGFEMAVHSETRPVLRLESSAARGCSLERRCPARSNRLFLANSREVLAR
jgi:hypothetical protein